MDEEEILQLVVDGVLDPDDVEEFREMNEELQRMVADGDIDDAKGISG